MIRALILFLFLSIALPVTIFSLSKTNPTPFDVPPLILDKVVGEGRYEVKNLKSQTVSNQKWDEFNEDLKNVNYQSIEEKLVAQNIHQTPEGIYLLAQLLASSGKPVPPEWKQTIKENEKTLNPTLEAINLINGVQAEKADVQTEIDNFCKLNSDLSCSVAKIIWTGISWSFAILSFGIFAIGAINIFRLSPNY